MGALEGIRVIDLTQMLAGPYATMLLADHGAEVIKVEPMKGDGARGVPVFHPEDESKVLNSYFQSINRNKKSITLDLKSEEGKTVLLELVADADVVVENFSAGVMDRLGLGYEVLKAVNPKIIYGSLSGFGRADTGESPYTQWPAFDVIAQAMGGIISVTGGEPGEMAKVGPGVGDIVPGILLSFGIVSALHHAGRTGEGQIVDIAMVDGVLALSERIVFQTDCSGRAPKSEGNHHPINSPFGLFPAKDGVIALAAMQDHYFDILCKELGIEQLLEDEDFGDFKRRSINKTRLIEEVSRATSQLSKQALIDKLGGKLPFGPVMDAMDIMTDEHFHAREMIAEVEQPGSPRNARIAGVPVKMSATPGGVLVRAPLLGEHNEEFGLQARPSKDKT